MGCFFNVGSLEGAAERGLFPAAGSLSSFFESTSIPRGKKIDSNAFGFLFTDNWNYMHMHYFVVHLREVKSSRNAHYHVGEFEVVLSCLRLSPFVVACLGF